VREREVAGGGGSYTRSSDFDSGHAAFLGGFEEGLRHEQSFQWFLEAETHNAPHGGAHHRLEKIIYRVLSSCEISRKKKCVLRERKRGCRNVYIPTRPTRTYAGLEVYVFGTDSNMRFPIRCFWETRDTPCGYSLRIWISHVLSSPAFWTRKFEEVVRRSETGSARELLYQLGQHAHIRRVSHKFRRETQT
jgi:hypothetical protein